jgi:hypothetical protein
VTILLGESLNSSWGELVPNTAPCAAFGGETFNYVTSEGSTGGLLLDAGACNYYQPSPGVILGSNGVATTTITAHVGDTISLQQQLIVQTEARVGPGISDYEFAGLDASDTGYFILDVLTPGAGYTSASGTQYLTAFPTEPVSAPEPASMVLLASGLLGVMCLRSRRL